MTALVVSVALICNPSFAAVERTHVPATTVAVPVAAVASVAPVPPPLPEETPWNTAATPESAATATSEATTSYPTPITAADTSAETTSPATTASAKPIDVAIHRLAELGAAQWQQDVFRCLAWFESTNNPNAISVTGDYGILQLNARYHSWRWAGRNVFDPRVNAEIAFDIYRESGFKAWTTSRSCNV